MPNAWAKKMLLIHPFSLREKKTQILFFFDYLLFLKKTKKNFWTQKKKPNQKIFVFELLCLSSFFFIYLHHEWERSRNKNFLWNIFTIKRRKFYFCFFFHLRSSTTKNHSLCVRIERCKTKSIGIWKGFPLSFL